MNFSFISSERLTKLIYNEFLVSSYVAIKPTLLTFLPSCLCRFLRLLDLHCGSWGIVPMARPSQIYGILVPAQVAHRRRVSFHHHNGAKTNKYYSLRSPNFFSRISPQHIPKVGSLGVVDVPRSHNR